MRAGAFEGGHVGGVSLNIAGVAVAMQAQQLDGAIFFMPGVAACAAQGILALAQLWLFAP